MSETDPVSSCQNVLINYHPSLACGLTSLLTGLTLFYVVYVNVPNRNRKAHFVPKFNKKFNAPEETDDNLEVRLRAWEAINYVPDSPLGNANEHFIFVGNTHTRFGNTIFQFVSGLAIGRALNRTVLFSGNFTELLGVFPNTKQYLRMAPPQISSGFVPLPHIGETGAAYYDSWIYQAIPKDVDVQICCYFQSYKYFQEIENDVRRMLKPNQKYVEKASTYFEKITNVRDTKEGIRRGQRTFVGVHVRRGDMATRQAWNAGRLAASAKYIQTAMKYYRNHYNNVQFVICSDDIHWCMDNIPPSNDVTFSLSGDYKFDLVLLSRCNHSIMTVGTFGWWGSWLTNGTVVYYDYQNKPGSYFARRMRTEDFFPPSWIPIGKILEEAKKPKKNELLRGTTE